MVKEERKEKKILFDIVILPTIIIWVVALKFLNLGGVGLLQVFRYWGLVAYGHFLDWEAFWFTGIGFAVAVSLPVNFVDKN